MIGSILAVVAFITAGLALSAWSIRIRGARSHRGAASDAAKEPPPLMSDFGNERRSRKMGSGRA
jgi:hypothetical protein